MADMWVLVVILAWCSGVCDGTICTRTTYHGYFHSTSTYIYCSYGCCGSSYNRYCCTSSGTIAGVVIAVLCGIAIVAFLACLCVKKQKRPGRVVVPNSNITHSNLTVVYAGVSGPGASNYRAGPPVPPPYKARDPPPPYSYGHFTTSNTGQNNRINTAGLQIGSYNPPPPSNYQTPPPQYPPMPQPDPPPRNITSPAPPYTPRATENNSAFNHPPPGPLPPPTAPVDHSR